VALSHESLDQTRTATIVLSRGSSAETLLVDKIVNNNWNEQLQGHFTRLKIVGLDRLQHSRPEFLQDWKNMILGVVRLIGVTSLDMTCKPSDDAQGRLDCTTVIPLALIFPNLTEVDLSYANIAHPGNLCGYFCSYCLLSQGYHGMAANVAQNMFGGQFRRIARITELHLDDTRFHGVDEHLMQRFSSATTDNEDYFFLLSCQHLERLSMKNATFTLSYDDEARPESQDFLIKMVHRHPTLRWLRSDLTDENASPCSRLSDPKCDICTLMKLLSCTFYTGLYSLCGPNICL
jgi:hypothetical protein